MSQNKSIFFVGIGGTGMSACAGLMQSLGHRVAGSDNTLYPPTSTLLADLNIPVYSPYHQSNIEKDGPWDLYVIANALSRGHEELEAVISKNRPYTSFPQLLGEEILQNKTPIVVTGTHGKTTTTALLCHMFETLNIPISYLIGGVPQNKPHGFVYNPKAEFFAIEGDEYDTCFFDKKSKFLHYFPSYILFNNIEFDHADIFQSLDQVEQTFLELFEKIEDKKNILAQAHPKVLAFLKKYDLLEKVTISNEQTQIIQSAPSTSGLWQHQIKTKLYGTLTFNSTLPGHYNSENFCQVLTLLQHLQLTNKIPLLNPSAILEALAAFRGVKKRAELLSNTQQLLVHEDFAHHPTAVKNMIETMKASHPKRRLIACFEPKNATARRNIFQSEYAQALSTADLALIGACPSDDRIPKQDQMNTNALAEAIGNEAQAFSTNSDLLDWLRAQLKPGDQILFMSPGNFSNIPKQLVGIDCL